ncbi:TPA: TIR domain-containing protein [Stenotrophomonas maltophilia]
MGRKIFVSYKYADNQVQRLPGHPLGTKVRHYVDLLQAKLEEGDHINKGEDDGESLVTFSDEAITSKLRERIYDSTLTLVMISPGMRNPEDLERNQWMPWEISYSLRHKTRNDRQSGPNALLGIVLPNTEGSYGYFFEEKNCPNCTSRTLRTDRTFAIIKRNAFNAKRPEAAACTNHSGAKSYRGNHSYIKFVKWSEFYADYGKYLDQAYEMQRSIDDYNISSAI